MNNELYHFGVKGMRWGVRRSRTSDTSKKSRNAKPTLSKEDKRYDKLARKDAKEYARAKMFYGESAGNRRKLIKNTVAQRRKDNAHYNKVFDKYLAEQNMDKHVSAAKRERKVKNAANFGHRVAKKAFNAATSTPYILMSDNIGNELYHFGVKGMHWGVRHERESSGGLNSSHGAYFDSKGNPTKEGEKAYKRFRRRWSATWWQADKTANEEFNKRLTVINNKPEYSVEKRPMKVNGKQVYGTFRDFSDKSNQKYVKEVSSAWKECCKKAYTDMYGEDVKMFSKAGLTIEHLIPNYNQYDQYIDHSYYGGTELYHFGVRGMKWGQRRYHNQDGSYTAQGRGRYDPNGSSSSRSRRSSSGDSHARLKKAAKIGAGVAAAGLAAYGGYRLAKSGKLSGLSSGVKSAASRVRSSNAGKKVGSGARRVANKVSNSGVGKRVQRGVNSAQYHATRIKNEMAYRRATSGGRNVRSNVIGIGGPKYSKVGAATYRVRSAASKARDVARTASSNSRRRAGELSSRMNSAASRYREMNKANRGAIRRNAIKVAGIGAGAGMVGYGATGIYAQTKKYRDARRRGRQNRR